MDHWPPLLADRRIAPARLIYDFWTLNQQISERNLGLEHR
jgi:hypothetical protein